MNRRAALSVDLDLDFSQAPMSEAMSEAMSAQSPAPTRTDPEAVASAAVAMVIVLLVAIACLFAPSIAPLPRDGDAAPLAAERTVEPWHPEADRMADEVVPTRLADIAARKPPL